MNVTPEEIGAVILILLLLASASIPFLVIGHFADKRDERKRRRRSSRSWAESDKPWPAHEPPSDHQLTKRERHPKAAGVKAMLLTLYEPKHDFLVGISDISTSTRLGFYSTHPYCRITIHEGWQKDSFLHEVGIHELAHHVAMTEFDHRFKAHGREFKTIYSVLMDTYNSKYAYIHPDNRYYLKFEKRVKSITLNTK